MRKISQALQEFNAYVEKRVRQNQKIEKIISTEAILNDRQKQLLFYFVSEEKASTTTSFHATLNDISRQTGASDLKRLEKLNLIKSKREGKYIRYDATERLRKLGGVKNRF